MTDLLGSSTESTIRVFVCFFLGLALGAGLAAVLVAGIRRPWRFLMWVELGIALLTVPLITLSSWSAWVWPLLGPEHLVSAMGLVVKTGLSLVLLLPAAILMGMTLPVLVSAVCVEAGGLDRETVRLYAVNTLGGVFGLMLVAGLTIPRLGVPWSMGLLAGINVLVAYACYRRSARAPERQACAVQRSGGSEDQELPWLALALAGFSGVGVMAIEVLALHLLNLSIPMSFYPPAAVLLVVVLLLALAAFAVPRAIFRVRSSACD